MIRCVAVFTDDSAHRLARFLEPGFRHVFVCVAEGDYWIRVNDAANRALLNVVAPSAYDLAEFYESEGYEVLAVDVRRFAPDKRWPLTPSNCVGLAKWVLGMRAPLVLTPYQLYRRLRRVHSARQGKSAGGRGIDLHGAHPEVDTAAGTRAHPV